MTEPHTALNLIQQTVAWAWLSGSIKRAQSDYRVGWSRDMLAALLALLQGPDISSSSRFKISRKLMASVFLNTFTCGREVQSPGTSLTCEIWHIYSYLCKANTRGTECPANPNWNIHIHLYPQMPEDSRTQCPNCWKNVCYLKSLRQKRGWSCLFETKAQRAGL